MSQYDVNGLRTEVFNAPGELVHPVSEVVVTLRNVSARQMTEIDAALSRMDGINNKSLVAMLDVIGFAYIEHAVKIGGKTENSKQHQRLADLLTYAAITRLMRIATGALSGDERKNSE